MMVKNVLIAVIFGGLVVGLILSFVFALLDRRQYRQLASRDGWTYRAGSTQPPGVSSAVMREQGERGVKYRHLVTGPDGVLVFRRTHQANRWDGDPRSSDRVKITWQYVHLPDTDVRPCSLTWDTDEGVTVESGDDVVERTVATPMFAERMAASPARPQRMLIEVGPSSMLLGSQSRVVPKKIPELVELVRSIERLLPTT